MTKANKLSMIRLFLIPFYIMFIFKPFLLGTLWNINVNSIIALMLLFVILITDYFDGVVARKYNEITLAGKLIDPTIDKIVTLLGFAVFVKYNDLSIIAYLVIVFREILILGFRLLLVSSNAPAEAKMLGKVKTALSFVLLCFVTLDYKILVINHIDFNNLIFIIVAALTFISGFDYVVKSWKIVKEKF